MNATREHQPRLTIGMPVFNDARFISESLSSVLAQEFSDFELIISDNGSTDGTSEICSDFAKHDARIRYERQPENRGAAWNFRRVLERASTEYFMWASSHDLLDSSLVRKCVALLDEDSNVVLVYARSRLIDREGQVVEPCMGDRIDLRGKESIQRVRTIVRKLSTCNMMYGVFRRVVLEKVRCDRPCIGPDHVMLLEIVILGEIAQIPDVLFRRREVRARATNPDEFHAAQYERLTGKRDPSALRWRYWRWYGEHIRSVLRSNVPITVRFRLTAHVADAFFERHRKRLREESPLATRVLARLRRIAKTVFK